MSNQQEITAEQYMINQTIDNLAKANATQALQIANLQAQLALIEAQSKQQAKEEEPIPGEDPIQSELEMPDIEH
jgi:hypothetical protein